MSNVSSNMCLAHLLECLWCVHNRLDCPHTAVLWWSTRMTSKSSPSPNSAVGTRASPFSHCWHSRYASDYGICLSWLCCVFWGRKWWAPMHPPSTHSTHSTRTQCLFSSDAPNARRHPGHGSCDDRRCHKTHCALYCCSLRFLFYLWFFFFRIIFVRFSIVCLDKKLIAHIIFISIIIYLFRCVCASNSAASIISLCCCLLFSIRKAHTHAFFFFKFFHFCLFAL